MEKHTEAYNQVIKDLATRLNDLLAETLYAAGHLHLMNTNPAAAANARSAPDEALFVNEAALLNSTDPRIQRIMQTHTKAEESLNAIRAYWITTSNWANGEEL